MDPQFWRERWRQSRIGFHLNEVNPLLIEHWSQLELAPGSCVFVPLAGKTLDMMWLASEGYQVVAVECSELAVQAFFDEQRLVCRQYAIDNFNVYESDGIRIFQGDYFMLDHELLGEVDAIYDRAALIAMPDNLREDYSRQLLKCAPNSRQMLLVTLQYAGQLMQGPPFSVSDQDVSRLYGEGFDIRLLQQTDIGHEAGGYPNPGLDYLLETVFHLHRL